MGFLSGLLVLTSLSGCGDTIPTLTDEENWKIAEYAAGLLLKYDAHHLRRLVSDEVINAAYEEAYKKAEWNWKVEQYIAGMENEKPGTDSNSSGSASSGGSSSEQVSYSIEEILGIENSFILNYTGYEIADSYPNEDSEDFYVAMDATTGNKLLILHYNMANIAGEDVMCDILHSKASFQLTVNDKKYGSQWTLLFDDFTQYYDTVAAGEERTVSIIFEVPEEKTIEIDTLELKVKCQDKSNRFVLF